MFCFLLLFLVLFVGLFFWFFFEIVSLVSQASCIAYFYFAMTKATCKSSVGFMVLEG